MSAATCTPRPPCEKGAHHRDGRCLRRLAPTSSAIRTPSLRRLRRDGLTPRLPSSAEAPLAQGQQTPVERSEVARPLTPIETAEPAEARCPAEAAELPVEAALQT